jgi:enoyl-CoA hydratase/carnithine racemase
MTEPVLVERRDAVQWITINRPERRNAINEAVIAAIGRAIAGAAADPAARAIVLTGAGDQAFCAGADLKPDAEGAAFEVDFAHPRHYVIDLFKQIEECTLPIVARVNGHALAGGLGLLCACDMAVAAEEARFGTPEARVGVFPMMILTYMLRVIPRRKLLEMCITAEQFDAAAALELGLVNYVVPRADLDAKLDWLLARIVDKSPTAIRLGKQAFHAMQDMTLREAFEFAQVMVPVMASTGDAREGMRAFQEKRAPRWTGR